MEVTIKQLLQHLHQSTQTYVEDLILIAESERDCMESKDLKVNTKKTKITTRAR